MIAVEHARLLGRKPELVFFGLQGVDAREQRLVQIGVVAMARQDRRDVALDRLQLVIGRRAGEVEEDGGDTVEAAAAALQRLDRIGEGRRRRVGGDGVDLAPRLFQRGREGGPEMARLDALERRRLERPGPGFEKRIALEVELVIRGSPDERSPRARGRSRAWLRVICNSVGNAARLPATQTASALERFARTTVFTHLKSPRGPLPQLAGEGGAIGRRKTPVVRRAMAPDGVWAAASGQVGLQGRHREPFIDGSCSPHPIRRHSPSKDGRLSTPFGGTFPASRRRNPPGACRLDDLSESGSRPWGKGGNSPISSTKRLRAPRNSLFRQPRLAQALIKAVVVAAQIRSVVWLARLELGDRLRGVERHREIKRRSVSLASASWPESAREAVSLM